MVGIALAHLGLNAAPSRRRSRRCPHRNAVIEAEVALFLAHVAPVRRSRTASSCLKSPIPRTTSCAFPLCRKMFYRTTQSADQETERRGDTSGIDQGLVRETACAIVDKLKCGRGHAARSARRAGEADRRGRRQGQRAADAVLRPRPRPRQGADEKAGRRARPARGHADPDQGPDQCRGRADHAGLADLQGHDPGAIRPPGRASRSQWRRGLRQIEHAGIRRRRQHLQRGVRRDAQSLGHVALRRRLLGRRGGRARNRHGLARARLRHGRLAAQSRELLRHRRHAAEHRPRRAYAGRHDRPQSRRRRARWRAMSRTSRCCSMP